LLKANSNERQAKTPSKIIMRKVNSANASDREIMISPKKMSTKVKRPRIVVNLDSSRTDQSANATFDGLSKHKDDSKKVHCLLLRSNGSR